jgi:shikimate kinase
MGAVPIPRRIILTGFMGTGKTEVGRLIAQSLDWPFFDTDDLIENLTGKTVAEIFSEEGEDIFRELEKQVLSDALLKEPLVLATGGGAIVDSENRSTMRKAGLLIALMASAEAIMDRTKKDKSRPLLQVDDPFATIQNLLAERKSFYEEADYVIDTTGKDFSEIVREIIGSVYSGH